MVLVRHAELALEKVTSETEIALEHRLLSTRDLRETPDLGSTVLWILIHSMF